MSKALYQSSTETSNNEAGTSLVFATAGHVDHGKTSLVQRLTGTGTDTLAEERQRGLTINLGFAYHHFTAENGDTHTLGFVDVPGHIDFINNMLAGVGGVGSSLLIIAADDGIMPQTREHLAILRLLAIELGAVVITKIDRCDEAQLQRLETDVERLLAAHNVNNAARFRVCAPTGEGIAELRAHLEAKALAAGGDHQAEPIHNFRYLIDRSFSVTGIGTVVTGSVRSGRAELGESVYHTGTGEQCRIKGMRLDLTEITRLDAGSRGALNINLPWQSVNRGDWLTRVEFATPCRRFDARVQFLDKDNVRLRNSAQYHLHIGASHYLVNLRWLDENEGLAQVKSNAPVHAHYSDRFIIRDPAAKQTLGGGWVIDIHVPHRGRGSAERISQLLKADREPLDALVSLLPHLPCGLDVNQFLRNRNITTPYFDTLRRQLLRKGLDLKELKVKFAPHPWIMDGSVYAGHRDAIIAHLRRFHELTPHRQGISESHLSREMGFPGSHQVLNAILVSLLESRTVMLSGTYLHLPDHRARLSDEEKRFLSTVRPLLETAGRLPPRTRELVEQTGIALGPLEKILKQATRTGHLIQIAANRHFLPETVTELAALAERLANETGGGNGFTVIGFRDASGLGRNLCIEILEYFDRVGFTRRDGNQRFLRTAKERLFARDRSAV